MILKNKLYKFNNNQIMKKVILTAGLFSLVMVLTSFTTPDTEPTVKIDGNGNVEIVGAGSAGGNKKVDIVGAGSAGGNKKVDIVGAGSAGGNKKVDIVGAGSAGGNKKVDE
jgi:hypothetical protein